MSNVQLGKPISVATLPDIPAEITDRWGCKFELPSPAVLRDAFEYLNSLPVKEGLVRFYPIGPRIPVSGTFERVVVSKDGLQIATAQDVKEPQKNTWWSLRPATDADLNRLHTQSEEFARSSDYTVARELSRFKRGNSFLEIAATRPFAAASAEEIRSYLTTSDSNAGRPAELERLCNILKEFEKLTPQRNKCAVFSFGVEKDKEKLVISQRGLEVAKRKGLTNFNRNVWWSFRPVTLFDLEQWKYVLASAIDSLAAAPDLYETGGFHVMATKPFHTFFPYTE